jgi:hypothetical protein
VANGAARQAAQLVTGRIADWPLEVLARLDVRAVPSITASYARAARTIINAN